MTPDKNLGPRPDLELPGLTHWRLGGGSNFEILIFKLI